MENETLEQSIRGLKRDIENSVNFLLHEVRKSASTHNIEYDYAEEVCRNILNKKFKENTNGR